MRARGLVAALVAVVAVAGCSGPSPDAEPTAQATAGATRTPWFGALEPGGRHLAQDRAAGMDVLVLGVSWADAEPSPGALSEPYLAGVRERYRAMRAAGLQVVLDPGLQYTPRWVFDLAPDARFTDQHGEQWHGPPGEDTADAVHVPAVRDAQAAFLTRLSSALGRSAFSAVRVGGLLDGELRYPGPGTGGSWWAYGRTAQEQTPVPGWRPGGDPAAARAFLDDYLDDITAYQEWLVDHVAGAFDGDVHVLYPSWGVRPGEADRAAAAGLSGATSGESRQTLQLGVEWGRQVRSLAASRWAGRAVAHTTWVDAPDQGEDASAESPVRFLAGLARPAGLRVSGENTGGDGDPGALARSVARVGELHLVGLLWMTEGDLYVGPAPRVDELTRLVRDLRARMPAP